MKIRRILSAIVLGVVGLACMPGASDAEAATASSETDLQRKKSLDDALRRIDDRAKSQINRVLDGQMGLGNSGSSASLIAEIERQRDVDKKALTDHDNKGRTGVVGLDGKLKPAPAPPQAHRATWWVWTVSASTYLRRTASVFDSEIFCRLGAANAAL